MTKYLGIDYGRAHVGLASAELVLATPLVSLANDKQLFPHLLALVRDEKIEIIVCGIPEGKLEGEIRRFAQQIKQKSGLQVILHPETLSTQEAILRLRAGKASRKKLKNEHVYAAALILEDYLEFQK